MIDKDRLARKLKDYQITLDHEQLNQLDKYAESLIETNKKFNLTAITAPEDIEDKHFLDSLIFANQPQVHSVLADIGTGAGFPGIVAKIYKPSLEVCLIEPTKKRMVFLQDVAKQLNLTFIFINDRAEELGRTICRDKFRTTTARAVSNMSVLSEYCIPMTQREGYFIAMKGDATEELKQASNAIQLLGGKLEETKTYYLPDGSRRDIVIIKKIKETLPIYPRNGGRISKKPL